MYGTKAGCEGHNTGCERSKLEIQADRAGLQWRTKAGGTWAGPDMAV